MSRPAGRRGGSRSQARPGARTERARAARPAPRPRVRTEAPYVRRRRVAALVVALLAFAGIAAGARVLLHDLGLADVAQVRVTGAVTIAENDVRAAVAVGPDVALGAVDTSAVAGRVAALPGVAAVDVRRDWPDTLVVDVTERVPVGLAQVGGELLLVDTTGLAYRVAPPGTQLPLLTLPAVAPDDPSTAAAVTVLMALPEPVRALTRTVGVDTAGGTPQVMLGLSGDRQVRWGSPDRNGEKATVLVALLTRPGRVYDVASPELPTVRP